MPNPRFDAMVGEIGRKLTAMFAQKLVAIVVRSAYVLRYRFNNRLQAFGVLCTETCSGGQIFFEVFQAYRKERRLYRVHSAIPTQFFYQSGSAKHSAVAKSAGPLDVRFVVKNNRARIAQSAQNLHGIEAECGNVANTAGKPPFPVVRTVGLGAVFYNLHVILDA